ncbi:hypothetical protein [Stenotrophomonas maltophilia]|jgi:hypothetical protein|uniref:hypothetical protein n=1 Tax=Stenotrophomonas maltophilia TaxID=40324 RepID=UPI002E78D3B4|nr:hypothetical protein [Stenotrophomonas maltophilia]
MSDPNFTDDEILMAADRFEIVCEKHTTRMQLADEWFVPGKHHSTIETCCKYARSALERGYDVHIKWKVKDGSTRIPEAASQEFLRQPAGGRGTSALSMARP